MVSFKRVGRIAVVMTVIGTLGVGQPLTQAQELDPTAATALPREQKLREQLKGILQELDDLKRNREHALPPAERPKTVTEKVKPEQTEATETVEAMPEYELADTSIVSKRMQKHPEGVSLSSTLPSETDSQPTRTVKESLESLPGVVLRQANGPRDFSIMIRGQGAKTTFAVRDIKIYEDGFMQTQSDGLSRLDIQDPWFMRSVEVTRGASSSLYDNYALGGMVQFRTRRGSDINGFETFLSGGSYGYHKEAFAVGQETEHLDISMFASNVAETGYIANSSYKTQTLNFNLRFKIDDKQNFYFKAISNWLDTRVPTRLTEAQFQANDRQAGGVQTTCIAGNYNNGSCSNSAALRQGRMDRRTIVGGMYERQLNANTILTIEGDYDVKDINQTFTQITDNVNPNFKHFADLRHDGRLGDMPLKSYLGFFFNRMEQEGQTFQNLADENGTRGTLLANNRGYINNIGGRFREELEFVPKWTLAAGLGFEHSHINVQTINYDPVTALVATRANADRDYTNWAPEVSLTWKPAEGYRHWVRSSTGYGIPQFSNLTRDPVTGQPGTNFDLKPQRNLNNEIGTESKLTKDLTVQLVGFWSFFKNEIITQTISSGNTASVNADSSQYRGVELFYDWRPVTGLRLSGAYTHIAAKYINFSDRTNAFLVRDGKQVPNVPTDVLNSKVSYEHAESGWGAWVEGSYYNSYFLNNSNTFGIPAYMIGNVNIHKSVELKNSWFRFAKFYLEMDNIGDKKYAASGAVIGGETHAAAASNQAFFAGYGRAIYGGVTLGLF